MPKYQMLIDLTRCIGCDACTVACKQENGTPMDTFFARVLNVEAGAYPNVKRMYIPVLCNHCEDPVCLKACPNKAIFKRKDGIVLIDQDRCKGTGACVSACPYGNIILSDKDAWYLKDEEPYEREYVKPRLKEGVARKCTYCAHRVDEGLKPACVVACPTTARIFGDVEDEHSDVSIYLREQKEQTGRDEFKLLPELGTKPSTGYLGTMARQETLINEAVAEPQTQKAAEARKVPAMRFSKMAGLFRAILPMLLISVTGLVQAKDVYSGTTCASCHGSSGNDGYAPKIAPLNMTLEDFRSFVREGKGDMPPTEDVDLSEEQLITVYEQLSKGPVEATQELTHEDFYSTTSCAGCHGASAMGGLGPPIAKTKMTLKDFEKIIREGKGMMPATKPDMITDEQIGQVHRELQAKEWKEELIPISYRVGALLSTKNTGKFFLLVALISFFFGFKVLFYWLKVAGLPQLMPSLKKLGYGRSAGVALKSLIVDGLFVASLYKKNKARWAMHGLMLYGFIGLMVADVLMQIYNPSRGDLPLLSPLKLLPVASGIAVLVGVSYVFYRYKKDEFIDNGLTLGRDFLFANLLLHTIFSGLLVLILGRTNQNHWVMPTYLYHLGSVSLLMLTAPFTRFMHVWIVPAMVAVTRLTEAVVAADVDLGFDREPSPGRHHKSLRIANDVVHQLDPQFAGEVRLRYYP